MPTRSLQSLSADALVLVSAAGATRMRQAADGTVIAEIDVGADSLLPPVTKWLRSDEERELGAVQGWPLTTRPWPAPYLAEGDEEFTYRVVDPSRAAPVELTPPSGIWRVKATLEDPRGASSFVVLERPEPGTWRADTDRQVRLWIAKLDPASWQTVKAHEVLLDGRTVARHLNTPAGRGISLSGDGNLLYVGVERFGDNTIKVMAFSTSTLEPVWDQRLTVSGEPTANDVSLELVVGTERDRLIVVAGRNMQNGVAPSALFVLDQSGKVLLDHATTPLEQQDRTTGLLVVGENEVVAHCAIAADNDEHGTLRLRSFNLATGATAARWDLPHRLIEADFFSRVSLWDGKRHKFLVAPVSYESARRAGFVDGIPSTVAPPATVRGGELGDMGGAYVKTPDNWYKPGRPRFDAWRAQFE